MTAARLVGFPGAIARVSDRGDAAWVSGSSPARAGAAPALDRERCDTGGDIGHVIGISPAFNENASGR